MLESSKDVYHGAVLHRGLLMGGSDHVGGKFDAGDGWVEDFATALEDA